MYQEIKSRRLALLVAIALTGGSLAGATNAYAAEVTGQNVMINASTPPSNNATDPDSNTGSAAGAINDPANGDDVVRNTLTLADYDYRGKNIFGGFTRGTGRAKDNIVHIRSGGTVYSAVGGITYGGGDAVGNRVYLHAGGLVDVFVSGGSVRGASGSAEDNHVVVESGSVNDFIHGGEIGDAASMGHVTGNTVTIAGGVIDAPVYGGYNNGSGNVTRNEVTVTGGINGSVIGGDTFGSGNVTGNTVTITGGKINGSVFGGDTHGSGNVTGNTVTITGGEIRDHVYGGFRNGDGDVKDNIVNIGDGAHDLAAGTRIDQSIYGGFNNGGSGTISGNILNVKASASAQNIRNFDKINFHFTDTLSPKLTLSDTAGTTIKSLSDITVNGFSKIGTSTLIENANGITVTDSSSVSTTGDTAETILSTDRTGKKIDYTRYIFKGARTAESSSFHETWGGRSVIGNTTTGNEITVSSGAHTDVCGGWTRDDASSQTATADKGNSTYNKVTVDGTATVSGNVYGGMTTVEDGKASYNEVTINGGTLSSGNVYGGSADSGSSADDNKVYLNRIHTPGTVHGGSTGRGTANGNEVHLNGATVTGAVIGGNGDSTSGNKVYLLNGATVTGPVFGGNGIPANDNEVHLNGATVTGPVYGGAANGTGNLLSVKGVNSAGQIACFQKVSFDTAGVAAGETMLNLNGGAGTTFERDAIDATGDTVSGGISLLHNANGITVNGLAADDNILKSETDETTEKNIAAHRTGGNITDIRYEGYQFAGVTTPVIDGGEAFGGISKAGNSTHDNAITVNGNYTNVYGGHTSGAGTTAVEKKNSHDNTVTITGGTLGNVYGGYTAAADGTTNNNTVTLAGGTVTGTVSGGNRTADGNTLNVVGMNNRAGSVENFQNMNFDATGAVKNSTLLTVTGTNATKVDWTKLTATGTSVKPLTLLKNESGIDLTSYTGAAKSETTDTTETNVDVRKNSLGRITAITYEGYQFAGAETASVIGTDAFGGISRAGNATHTNHITVNGDYTNVYGGHTSGTSTTAVEKKNSHDNTVTITGGTIGNVYGGYTAAADGTTNHNTVTLAGGTVTGTVSGGNRTAQGNKLVVNANARVGRIENFEKYVFNYQESMAANPMLTLTGGAAAMNLSAIEANGTVTETPTTLVHNAAGLTIADYDNKPKSMLNADGTRETNLDVKKTGTLLTDIIRYSSYRLKGTTESTTSGGNTWGGRSAAGNTTAENSVTITGGNHTNIYGGWTTGTGSTAAADALGDSISNKVAVNGSAAVSGTVYGGYTDVTGGRATGNEVTIEKASVGSVVGGYGTTASSNVINLTDATVSGSVTGGRGTITNDNIIRLRNTKVTGTVTGGSGTITNENRTGFRSVTVSSTAASGTGNTLAVYYGTGTTSIGDLGGIQNIHFDLEDAPTDGTAHTLLSLTNAAGEKNLSDINLAVHRSGATKKLRKGDTFTLVENTTAGGLVSIGDNVTAEGTDGVTRSYTFGIARNADGKLVATVTKAGMNEQAKSLVETRAGASAFLNDGADFLAGAGMSAAQKEAAAAAMTSGGVYGLWAGMGGGSLRHETGSYVDMKGWNLGVGWARENAVKAGTLTFGPFIEYGRGSYDSYLDDGTHGSGKTSYVGVGMMAKLETKANSWIDGALRVGRTKSDYTGLDTGYDTTSTYYTMHVGVGKDFRVREGDTVSAYVRYSYAHTAGTSAHLSSGETYDFDAVNSHRLRIGTRYTHGETALSQFYAGLAWEYEFGGDARATYDGDSAPSPSLRGGSALLELGYRFAPKVDSRVSYDLNLSGWQGKRQGVTGGVSVKWAF